MRDGYECPARRSSLTLDIVLPEKKENKFHSKVIFALFFVHFSGDFFMSFVNPLLPVLADKLALTMTQVGLVAGLSRALAFVIQPTVGYIADHYRTRFFILGGPILTALFIPFLGVVNSFSLVLVFVVLGSLGSSMFHPTAAGMVSDHAGKNLGFSMSLFHLGGTAAFGIGPLFVTWYVNRFELTALPYVSLIGVGTVTLLFLIVPKPETEGLANLGFIGSIRDALGAVWKPIVLIWFLIVLRTFVSQSFMTFAPIMFSREGYSLIDLGRIIAAYVIAGSISGVIAGHVSDRVGYRPLFLVSYALSTPALYLFLRLSGQWVYLGAFASGFILLSTLPLAVAMAQELAPKGKSLVSSLMMGLAFGTGGILTPLTGKLSDMFGIRPVLDVILWIPFLAIILVWRLPVSNRRRHI
jgi:MFS transporter, FSR family, fosmidomycin resistance protein